MFEFNEGLHCRLREMAIYCLTIIILCQQLFFNFLFSAVEYMCLSLDRIKINEHVFFWFANDNDISDIFCPGLVSK